MMIADKLGKLHIDYIADFARQKALFDLIIKRRIPEHKTNHYFSAVFLRLRDEISRLLLGDGKRFLKQNIKPHF